MAQPDFVPKLPHRPGVYFMRDARGNVVYIGKARDLKKRVSSYFLNRQTVQSESSRIAALVSTIRQVDYIVTQSEREALVLERRLIGQYQPVFNVMWKDDKSYPYVKITLNEDFPRLELTRHKKRDRCAYFGPYPNVGQVRQLLRWLWRKKFFPLRPCRYEFSQQKQLDYKKVRHCLYFHTGECSAPCIGRISTDQYKLIVQRALWFFRGQQKAIIKNWKQEMGQLSKELRFEEAARLRDRINTLEHMNEHVLVHEITEEQLSQKINDTRAVQQLRQALNLRVPPERIECFDISHFQGQEKVASMVSFYQGKPDKQNYRKFIITSVRGIDDFKSIYEVVYRRYLRLKNEASSLPNLVLIDGGKGQLSSALRALADAGCAHIPIAALAKENEEVFIPSSNKAIKLPADSPALLLLRHVRDEAHRFAVTFNRRRRQKAFIRD